MNTPNNIVPEEVLPSVEKMLHAMSWRYAKAYPVPYEECLSESYAAFMYACERFRPGKLTKFSSYCYFIVSCKLKDLVTSRTKDPLVFVEIDDDLCGAAPPPPEFKKQVEGVLKEVSADAACILDMLLETPMELLRGPMLDEAQIVERVYQHLRRTVGLDPTYFRRAMEELSQHLNRVWST